MVPQRWEALFGADRGVAAGLGADAGSTQLPALPVLPVLTVVTAGAPAPEGARRVAAAETERGRVELWLTTARRQAA